MISVPSGETTPPQLARIGGGGYVIYSGRINKKSEHNLTTPETTDILRGLLITGEQLAMVSVIPHAQW